MNAPFPNISADSLYKFLAILGVALFISPSFLDKDYLDVELEIIDLQKDIAKQNRQLAVANLEIQQITKAQGEISNGIAAGDTNLDQIGKGIDEVTVQIAEVQRRGPPYDREQIASLQTKLKTLGIQNELQSTASDQMSKQLSNLSGRSDAIATKLDVSRGIIEDKDFDLQKVDAKLAYLSRVSFLGTVSRVAGALMVVMGFMLWYLQVQQHVDKSIRLSPGGSTKTKKKER